MPDLSHEASAKYWFEYVDPMIYKVITFMESVEEWTADGDPELEEMLIQLGKELDDVQDVDINAMSEQGRFVKIAANIKTGRGLRLLQTIDTIQPGSASRVLMHAEESSFSSRDTAGFFLKRNITFERLRLLGRVFCAYRLNLVLRALEGDE